MPATTTAPAIVARRAASDADGLKATDVEQARPAEQFFDALDGRRLREIRDHRAAALERLDVVVDFAIGNLEVSQAIRKRLVAEETPDCRVRY